MLEKLQAGFDFPSGDLSRSSFVPADPRDAALTVSILDFPSRSLVPSFCEECTQIDFPAVSLLFTNECNLVYRE